MELIPVVILFGLLWLLLIRPQQRRKRAQEELIASVEAGDEILSAGGLYGTVRELVDDEVLLEIAPGTTVRLDKRAVAVVYEPEPDEEPEPEAEPEAES